MRRLVGYPLLLAAALLSLGTARAELTRNSRVFIKPFDGFETYLEAAFSKEQVPVTIVEKQKDADLTLTILNDGHRVTGVQVASPEDEILWTYLLRKPSNPGRKIAEKCAREFRHQFPPSPEEEGKREQRAQEERQAEEQAAAAPRVSRLCYGRFRVPAGTYSTIPFQVAGPATVQGNFEARGGAGNDIQVVVGPRSAVLNWLNGHGGAVTYASEKETSGTLNVSLNSGGDYVLAFSNRFSIVSDKVVGCNIQVVVGGTR